MRKTELVLTLMLLGAACSVRAVEALTPTPSATVLDFDAQKQKLELERLQLENDKLRLEMEQLKAQASQTPSVTSDKGKAAPPTDKEIKGFQTDESKRAEDLSQKNKDKSNLIVLDLVNDEIWYKGIRYELDRFHDMATDQKWPLKRKLDERDGAGYARYLDTVHNVSLLKYENRDKGIFTLKAPQGPDDLDFLTTTSVGSSSSEGDFRTGFRNIYFEADGEDTRDGMHVLKYKHGHFLGFDEQIELYFDRDNKFVKLRYGVLGQN